VQAASPRALARQLQLLERLYPQVTTALVFGNAFELLVATVLAAQCTDVRVNQVTPALFGRWPTPEQLATATPAELEEVLANLPLFRSKARHLAALAARLTDAYDGHVPADLDVLVQLPAWVARRRRWCWPTRSASPASWSTRTAGGSPGGSAGPRTPTP